MSGDAVAIRLNKVSMAYNLYDRSEDRLKEALHPLRKTYHRKFYALKELDLQIRKGEIYGIVGVNGSGKSTLLKVICGVLNPTSGNVQVQGNISAMLELGSGFNPEFTGYDNIYFYGSILGFTRQEMDEKIDDILAFAELGDFIHQPVKVYSSGMKARLGFGVAIHVDPDILIIDEVLAVGDALFQRKCFAKIESFIKSGKTVIFVSHNAGAVVQLCTKAVLIDKGEFLMEGEPKDIVSQYEKLLFSKGNEKEKTRNEIKSENRDYPDSTAEGKRPRSAGKTDPPPSEKHCGQVAHFLPSLKTKSLLENKKCQVDIEGIALRAPSGEKVNYLVLNERYACTFRVEFGISVNDLSFGISFKTHQGLILGGWRAVSEDGEYTEAQIGDVFEIEHEFVCRFLPGLYYVKLNVRGDVGGGDDRLVVIDDAYAFKVQNVPKLTSVAHVYLDQKVSVRKLADLKASPS